MVLMTAQAAEKLKVKPLARIVGKNSRSDMYFGDNCAELNFIRDILCSGLVLVILSDC